VTARYGVEGFTADHLALLKASGVQRVLIAYDRDEAGDRAAEKLARQLIAEGLDCYRILFPKGMDANEYALKVGPAAKSLGVAIRSAQWLGKGAAPGIEVAPSMGATPCQEAAFASVESNTVVSDPPLAAKDAAPESVMPSASPLAPTMATPTVPPVAEPAASVQAPAPTLEPACEVTENEILLGLGDRRYRVRGLTKNLSLELLRVNVMVSRGERFHLDTFDFYAAKARAAFASQAAVELVWVRRS
jgi:DNA primase